MSESFRKMVFDLRRKIGTVCGASLMKAEDVGKTPYYSR